jgi:hypothetical protein
MIGIEINTGEVPYFYWCGTLTMTDNWLGTPLKQCLGKLTWDKTFSALEVENCRSALTYFEISQNERKRINDE